MEENYSKAFEEIVRINDQDEEDLVGLLAYAYYKKHKRDAVLKGDISPEEIRIYHKTLTKGLIEQYRETALRRLETYAGNVIEKITPEIEDQTRTAVINAAKNDIISAIESRTSGWTSILWNVVAWLITLAVTFLIVVSSGAVSINIVSGVK